MRPEIQMLEKMGRFPAEAGVTADDVDERDALLTAIEKPLTDEEACVLVRLFGPDSFFGVAWEMLHLIETAPGWPLVECLTDDNEWIEDLKRRAGLPAKAD
jgi:hypothetical protein